MKHSWSQYRIRSSNILLLRGIVSDHALKVLDIESSEVWKNFFKPESAGGSSNLEATMSTLAFSAAISNDSREKSN